MRKTLGQPELPGNISRASAMRDVKDIEIRELDMQEHVGGGGFSVVYRGYWKHTQVAIKKWVAPEITDEIYQEFREEAMTLGDLRHPNIVQVLGACNKVPDICLVTEYLPTNLYSLLHERTTPLDRPRIICLALDVARAFVYLHSLKPPVTHRDLKSKNLLLDRQWRVKLCDFGLATTTARTATGGTPAYMAPELLNGEGKPFNSKVDVFAFGILLNEMYSREIPFDGMAPGDVHAAIRNGERPSVQISCPMRLKNLIQLCWDADPEKRPDFEGIAIELKDMGAV